MNLPNQIAIDGPAASGKTTVGVLLAERLGYLFFDTGVMYRAVTWAALQHLQSVNDEQKVTELAEKICIDIQPASVKDKRQADILLDGVDITWDVRKPEVDGNVSQVSAYPGVRSAMTMQQRRIGQRGKVVMVGRDIGTVVLPEAELKVYLDASAEERARRRSKEINERGGQANYDEILAGIKKRDQIDSTRAVAPLKPAADAKILCTDGLTVDQVVKKILDWVK